MTNPIDKYILPSREVAMERGRQTMTNPIDKLREEVNNYSTSFLEDAAAEAILHLAERLAKLEATNQPNRAVDPPFTVPDGYEVCTWDKAEVSADSPGARFGSCRRRGWTDDPWSAPAFIRYGIGVAHEYVWFRLKTAPKRPVTDLSQYPLLEREDQLRPGMWLWDTSNTSDPMGAYEILRNEDGGWLVNWADGCETLHPFFDLEGDRILPDRYVAFVLQVAHGLPWRLPAPEAPAERPALTLPATEAVADAMAAEFAAPGMDALNADHVLRAMRSVAEKLAKGT